jgi:hypothetical protein
MRLESIPKFAACAVLLASGCGTGSKSGAGTAASQGEVTIDIAKTAQGWTFQTGAFTLAPGQERYLCYTVTTKEALAVSRFRSQAHPIVHHLLMSEATAPEQEGESECDVLFRTTWLPMFFGTTADTDVPMPDGAAKVVGAGKQVVVQLHLVNTSTVAVTDSVAIDMTRSTLEHPDLVSVFAFGTTKVSLPPKQVTILEANCTPPKDLHIFALLPHMHFLGKKMELLLGPDDSHLESAYVRDPYDFNNQFIEKFDVVIPAGTATRLRCTYDNDRDKAASFGESSFDEMCFAAGLAVGGSGESGGCIEGAEVPDGGVPRAANAGVCGQVVSPTGVGKACTKDGAECPTGMICSAGQAGAPDAGQGGMCIQIGCKASTECGAGATCCAPRQGGGLVNICIPEACRPLDCVPAAAP